MPIGILLLAYLMALLSKTKRFQYLNATLPFVLLVGIVSSVIAFVTGWVMPKEGNFDDSLISWHLWFAVGMTISTIIVYLIYTSKNDKLKRLFVPGFTVSIILLSMTGHYGGSLTHGENFLTTPFKEEKTQYHSSIEELHIYKDVITPILKNKCYSCHNEGKQKGELIMSTINGLLVGGKEGHIIKAGFSEESSLISRIQLPIEEEKHMPPKGKKQLSEKEIQLLTWWIDNGAEFDKRAGEINRDQSINKVLKTYIQNDSGLRLDNIQKADASVIQALTNMGIVLEMQSEDSPLLSVLLSRDTSLTKNKLKKLKKVADNINELDLSFSNIDDSMLEIVSRFKNLRTLKLNGTSITSEGLKHVDGLTNLGYLNIYQTRVDDRAFSILSKLESLKKLYVWQSSITDSALSQFKNDHPKVTIHNGINQSLFKSAQLKPPVIAIDKPVFENETSVEMKSNLQQLDIRYTLDGSIPDSTSLKYISPFTINKTSLIRAISRKQGWMPSSVAQLAVIKKGHDIETIQLGKKPSKKYKANGASTLIDNKLGSTSFSDNSWLGYEGENAHFIVDLGSVKLIENVSVGVLEDIGSFIFFPKSIGVQTSLDGQNYTSTVSTKIPISTETAPPSYKSILISIPPLEARYLKVSVKGVLENPSWHTSPGAKSWTFIDEIMVN